MRAVLTKHLPIYIAGPKKEVVVMGKPALTNYLASSGKLHVLFLAFPA
jgi:hypothetical protein